MFYYLDTDTFLVYIYSIAYWDARLYSGHAHTLHFCGVLIMSARTGLNIESRYYIVSQFGSFHFNLACVWTCKTEWIVSSPNGSSRIIAGS